MSDWHSKDGKLVVDGDHYTYWNSGSRVYVRDGKGYRSSRIGPHFLDLGIMGSCTQSCYRCYMQGRPRCDHMQFDDVERIIHEWRGSLCQVSFGGSGDPLDYPQLDRLSLAGVGPMRWERESGGVRAGDYGSMEKLVSWGAARDIDLASVQNIGRHITINVRNRALTEKDVGILAGFDAVGLSCSSGGDDKANIIRLLREVERSQYDRRPKFILHVIVDQYHTNLRGVADLLSYDSVAGVLLLARKKSKGEKAGPFHGRKAQQEFWEGVAAVHEVFHRPVGVDSCLAPFVDPKIFPSARFLHPCDAGRFSVYVHADGELNLCSCDGRPAKSWDAARKMRQNCKGVGDPGQGGYKEGPPKRRDPPEPDLVIQYGPMTNSSSSSYFLIAPENTPFKLEVLDFTGRAKRIGEMWREDEKGFNWYGDNQQLVRISSDEWGSWCALAIGSEHECKGMPAAVKLKKELDTYTTRIVKGELPYYLVANRDDGGVPPTHYRIEDVVGPEEKKSVVLLNCGEEH